MFGEIFQGVNCTHLGANFYILYEYAVVLNKISLGRKIRGSIALVIEAPELSDNSLTYSHWTIRFVFNDKHLEF